MSTVVKVEEFDIADPSKDRSHLYRFALGYFSRMEGARKWLRRRIAREKKELSRAPDDHSLTYFRITRCTTEQEVRILRTEIIDSDGNKRGVVRSECYPIVPWSGRPRESLRFKEKDLVGWIYNCEWRIGVITDLAPSPDDSPRRAWDTTDDCYTIGMWDNNDLDFSDHDTCLEAQDHDHVEECLLWPTTSPLDPKLEAALDARYKWSEEECPICKPKTTKQVKE